MGGVIWIFTRRKWGGGRGGGGRYRVYICGFVGGGGVGRIGRWRYMEYWQNWGR